MIQGAGLKRNDHEELFGNLERRLIGPAEIEGEIDLEKIKKEDWNLASFPEDHILVSKKDSSGEKYMVMYGFLMIRDRNFNKEDKLHGFFWPKPVYKKIQKKLKNKIYDKEENEILKDKDIPLAGGIIKNWGGEEIGEGAYMNLMDIKLWRTKEDKKRFIGKVNFRTPFKEKWEKPYTKRGFLNKDVEDEILRLEKEKGIYPQVYTIKKGDEEIKPAVQSKMPINAAQFMFMPRDKYSNIEDFGLGIFPVKEGEIQGDPIYFTKNMADYLSKNKDKYEYFNKIKIHSYLEGMELEKKGGKSIYHFKLVE